MSLQRPSVTLAADNFQMARADLNLTLARRFILVSVTRSLEWAEYWWILSRRVSAIFQANVFRGHGM